VARVECCETNHLPTHGKELQIFAENTEKSIDEVIDTAKQR
jgi:hypothetical protein